MPFYHRLGELPHKRHTQFRKPDGTLYREEVMGIRGFSGVQSILYHEWQPTSVTKAELIEAKDVTLLTNEPLEHHHLAAAAFESSGDPVTSRTWLLANHQVKMGLATPTAPMDYHYRNGTSDELLFVHYGTGSVVSQFGLLEFEAGDYIVLPVGTTYKIETKEKCRFLVIESSGRIEFPKRYRNEYGQLLEHAPFCERDIRVPERLVTHREKGSFEVRVRMGGSLNRLMLDHHPLDVVGWDGYLYPWIFNIRDFEPITGRIHQPPPVHQTFAADGYVICSFCPRLYDYHPDAIPVPYNHSNVNSDEVLYYVEGNFMSRRGINAGSFTHHPAGLPHGPHPGTVEASLGKTSTEELAVMLDTFMPLYLTPEGKKLCDPNYVRSWLE
jgi:homogentisate 1,2-dioxygenase